MATISETGHAKNVATFKILLNLLKSSGTAYKPSQAVIKLDALQTTLTSGETALEAVNTAKAAYTNLLSPWTIVYKPFNKLITRISNALKASNVPETILSTAASIVRELRGRRASTSRKEGQQDASDPEGKETKEISVSQVGIDDRLNNFDRLIKLLETVTEYIPNEEDLKVDSLKTYYGDLKAKHDTLVAGETDLYKARLGRDEILYKDKTGLVPVANACKSYAKSSDLDEETKSKIQKLSFRNFRKKSK